MGSRVARSGEENLYSHPALLSLITEEGKTAASILYLNLSGRQNF
jgi:hypothetical protein